MNYIVHHDRLIDRARERVLEGYKERHHVIPRCMGGDNSPGNIVCLTPEEHYVIHQLLVKIYPKNRKLAHAAVWMAKRVTGNKAYGWLKRRHVQAISESLRGIKRPPRSPEHRLKLAAANRGKTLSPETRAKVSASSRGRRHSQETRNKMSEYARGRRHSSEARAKMAAAKLGKPMPPDVIQKRAASQCGAIRSVEARARMSAARRATVERKRLKQSEAA